MYTSAGAQLTGEAELKGTITEGKYGDLAVLSADYFSVADEDIDRIEALVTVAGGKVVYAAGDYENIAAPLPEISPAWSPVARFGGFQAATDVRRTASGARQARAFVDAAADSEEQRAWREGRGDFERVPQVPHQVGGALDPLDGCF
jgi:hypothetical protein